MNQELFLVKACANYDPHTIKFFDDEAKEVGELAMKDGVLTFTGNADESAKLFVQHVCDRTFQLTSQIKELEQEKAVLLRALSRLADEWKYRERIGQVSPGNAEYDYARAAIAKAERRDV